MPSVMRLLLVCVTSLVLGEEGVCNVKTQSDADNKTNTEGCGVEENRIKDEEYSKLRWTDSEDWEIREQLDITDELIVLEPEKAVEEFRWDFISRNFICNIFLPGPFCKAILIQKEETMLWPGHAR